MLFPFFLSFFSFLIIHAHPVWFFVYAKYLYFVSWIGKREKFLSYLMPEHSGNYLIGTGKMLKMQIAMSLAHLLFTCLDWQYYTTSPQIGCAHCILCLLPLENIWWNFRICRSGFPTTSEAKYIFLPTYMYAFLTIKKS